MAHWIVKTEPETYSLDQLEHDGSTWWDGVRNYQARNNLRKMLLGDQVLIYHSVGPREIVGLAQVTCEARPDQTATDGDWVVVELKFVKRLAKPVSLRQIKAEPRLAGLGLLKQSRLSVCPVSDAEFLVICELARM